MNSVAPAADRIAAIETHYAGCRFRSRLEARWTVWFEHLGIAWEYEPQGFKLPSGALYLPDFRLPELDLWVEVKGDEDEFKSESARYAEAALNLGGNGLMVLGPIPDLRLGMPQHFVLGTHTHCCGEKIVCLHIAWADMLTSPAALRETGLPCTDLMTHDIDRFPLPPLKGYGRGQATWTLPHATDWPLSTVGAEAYSAARSARFEHGEKG